MRRSAFAIPEIRTTTLRALNYAPDVERLRTRTGRSVRLGTLAEIGRSYGARFTLADCAPEHGVELLSQADMFSAEPTGRVIRIDSMPNPNRHLVKPWQVLVAGAGTLGEYELYGRCVIADRRLAGKYVGPHALVLTFHDEAADRSLYSYAFLSSALGIRALRSASYGTKVLALRVDVVADLPIPLPDDTTISRVASLVRESVKQREHAATSLARVRQIVSALPEMIEAHAMCARRTRRAVAWEGPLTSLSARSVALAGAAAARLYGAWASVFADWLEPDGIFTGPRFARIDCDGPAGIELMSQRDMFLVRPLPQRVVPPGGDLEKLKVRPGTILSCAVGQISEGTLFGRVFFAADDTSHLGFSQNIMRFQVREGAEYDAFAFLSTTVGYRLLQSAAAGSGYMAMSPRLVRTLPYPRFPGEISVKVKRALQELVDARSRAQSIEAEAIRIVEEEVLTQWLG